MKWGRVGVPVLGLVAAIQGCGPGDSPEMPASGGQGPTGGGPASSSGGAALSGGTSAGGQQPVGSGGNGPFSGGAAAGGDVSSGGSLASGGVAASGGDPSTGGLSVGGAPGAGGSFETGGALASGGSVANPSDAPCPVPAYIFEDTRPIGWAASGSGTTGGGSAQPILVSSLEDFQDAVSGTEPAVIFVQGSFSPSNLSFGSNKTIIGCSPGATLKGHLQIGSGSSNLIFRNLNVSGYGVGNCALDPSFDAAEGCSSGEDAISINGTAHHVWVDHVRVMDGTDGNLDITNNADAVTVSWTKFAYTPRTDDVGSDKTGSSGHRYSNLVGGTDTAPDNWPSVIPLNVTWHHNWWADNVVERQPRVRYGRNHLFNNYYSSAATNYCVRAGIEASILLEGNYFQGVDSPHEFNSTSNEGTAFIKLGSGDRQNVYDSVSGSQSTGGGGEPFSPEYSYSVDPAASVPSLVQAGAGPH